MQVIKDGVSFQPEQFALIYEEILPLFERHYREVSANQDIPLEVAREQYIKLDEQNFYHMFTARNAFGKLIGYAGFFIRHNLHYMSSLQAVQDIIFIDKEHRGFGRNLIAYADQQLKELGVQVVYQHVKCSHNWSHILVEQGYKHVEQLFSKRLDKES